MLIEVDFIFQDLQFSMASGERNGLMLILMGAIAILGIITLILAAVTLGTVKDRSNTLYEQIGIARQEISNLTLTLFRTTTTSTSIPTLAPTTTNTFASTSTVTSEDTTES